MFITLYQEYENQNHYTSELLLIFRRCSYFHPQCPIHSGLCKINEKRTRIQLTINFMYVYLYIPLHIKSITHI